MSQPRITGQWTQADPTQNRLELAPTDQPGLFALRDSYDQSGVIYATGKQVRNFADSVQKGHLPVMER